MGLDDDCEGSYEYSTQLCCHEVSIRYWDFKHKLTSDLIKSLIEEGENRAKECISVGCGSGELNCLYDDEEIRGWFNIVRGD